VVFAQTLFTRAVDPVIPMIAGDLAIDVKTAALLSSAYTFPYALVQPALGVTGDFFGMTRADEFVPAGHRSVRAGLCSGDELLATRRHADRGRAGGGRDIQVHVTELSQTARGAAASLHSSFFYLGQAVGPVVYGYGFAHGGPEPSIFVGAAVVMTVGVVCSRLLRHRTVY
jgi:predicted MFS family arabinose efflux permease